jgi:serine-type D-Ala-D-Ala carboxypeptidase/endopeptidase (penicillin-binding protein 4)
MGGDPYVGGSSSFRSGRLHRDRTERGSAMHKVGAVLVALVICTAVGMSVGWLPRFAGSQSGNEGVAKTPTLAPAFSRERVRSPAPILQSASDVARLKRSPLRQLLANSLRSRALGSHVEVVVGSLQPGGPLVHVGGSGPVTPASLLKLLTVTAALEVLGPDHRFPTSAVQGRTSSDVVLVGGGDPLLASGNASSSEPALYPYPQPASLVTLARRTAAKLQSAGVRRVRVHYDTSLFTGPAFNTAWPASYRRANVVSPISPLWVNEGRARPGKALRVGNPAGTAAQRFATLLRSRGLAVAATVTKARHRPGGPPLARVRSAPLSAIVQHIVELSDNEGAEVLLRHVAIATGHTGSSAAGVRVVTHTLTAAGVDLSGASFADGSGLARSDQLPIRVLVDVLRLAASPDALELHPVVASLPVAGFTGSLAYRFSSDARAGLGVVRAKTGTLTHVHGLAGIVSPAHGSPLVFAAAADRVPVRRTLSAVAQLDRIAARIATCDCSR